MMVLVIGHPDWSLTGRCVETRIDYGKRLEQIKIWIR